MVQSISDPRSFRTQVREKTGPPKSENVMPRMVESALHIRLRKGFAAPTIVAVKNYPTGWTW